MPAKKKTSILDLKLEALPRMVSKGRNLHSQKLIVFRGRVSQCYRTIFIKKKTPPTRELAFANKACFGYLFHSSETVFGKQPCLVNQEGVAWHLFSQPSSFNNAHGTTFHTRPGRFVSSRRYVKTVARLVTLISDHNISS